MTPTEGTSAEGHGPVTTDTELKRVMGPKLLLLFIVGDILGTGIYALTGQVAAEVGGAAWLPFLVAFIIATLTAFSYLELVTKYPQAAGAALYVHKAFGVHFVTFIIAFAVMSSGITSASTAARAFASNFAVGVGWEASNTSIMLVALGFMALVMAVNFRGASESIGANVVLTLIELTGLVVVVLIGFYAMSEGRADFSRAVAFNTPDDKNVFLAVTTATSLAFFAMVGFEDSVNMAEETRDPSRIFPKVMLTGLGITGFLYVLVSICAVALVPIGKLADNPTPLLTVVQTGAPGFPTEQVFPFISMVAVANSALINMMMASRLLYGMSRQRILPPFLGKVHSSRRTPWAAILFTTGLAFALVIYVSYASENAVAVLGGTTSLLLLGVFAVVNIAVLVVRKDTVDHKHFRTPTIVALIGSFLCVYLVTPLSGRDVAEYEVAGGLLVLGLLLWVPMYILSKRHGEHLEIKDPTDLAG